MTNSQEGKSSDSRDSRTINIEIPSNCFDGMFNMMSGRSGFGKAGTGCCETVQDICCPQSADNVEQEIKIVIKRKKHSNND